MNITTYRQTYEYVVKTGRMWQTVAVGLSVTDCNNIRTKSTPARIEGIDYKFGLEH